MLDLYTMIPPRFPVPDHFLLHPTDYGGDVFVSFKIIKPKEKTKPSIFSFLLYMLGIAPQPYYNPLEEFHIFRDSTAFLFPITLKIWHMILRANYTVPTLGRSHINTTRWSVTDISVFKGENGVQYEGLIVTLRYRPSSASDCISVGIRIERGNTEAVYSATPLHPSRYTAAYTTSIATSHSISPAAERLVGGGHEDVELYSGLLKTTENVIQNHKFSADYQINLPQLLLIATLAQDDDDDNDLTRNCHWYSEIVIAMVHECVHRMKGPDSGETRVEIISKENITADNGRPIAKWKCCGLKDLRSNEDIRCIVQSKMELFEEQWKIFEIQIGGTIDVTQHPAYQALVKKYEEKLAEREKLKEDILIKEKAAQLETENSLLHLGGLA